MRNFTLISHQIYGVYFLQNWLTATSWQPKTNIQASRTGLKDSRGGILFQFHVFNLESSDKIIDHVF